MNKHITVGTLDGSHADLFRFQREATEVKARGIKRGLFHSLLHFQPLRFIVVFICILVAIIYEPYLTRTKVQMTKGTGSKNAHFWGTRWGSDLITDQYSLCHSCQLVGEFLLKTPEVCVDYVVFLVEKGDAFSKFPRPTGSFLGNVCCVKTLHLYKIKIITFSTKVITFPVWNLSSGLSIYLSIGLSI